MYCTPLDEGLRLAGRYDNALTQWPRFVYLQAQGHQLRPNFRTFLLATEHQGQFIVQWLDYYHPVHGGSGHLRLRVQPLP